MINSMFNNPSMSPLDLALAYAGDGIPVFPCDPRTKTPLVAAARDAAGKKIAKSGGLYQATTGTQTITEWWTKHPDAMIGMPTGTPSGFVVLDVDFDPEKGIDGFSALEELCKKHGPMPTTGKVQTPRGGTHYYFRLPAGVKINNSAGMIAPGIDFRGEGGYIIAPGSIRHDGQQYNCVHPIQDRVEIPNWIVTLISKGRTSAFKGHNTAKSRVLNVANSNIDLDHEVAKVAQTLAGGRNDALTFRYTLVLHQRTSGIQIATGITMDFSTSSAGAIPVCNGPALVNWPHFCVKRVVKPGRTPIGGAGNFQRWPKLALFGKINTANGIGQTIMWIGIHIPRISCDVIDAVVLI